jgi:hypothetical protein
VQSIACAAPFSLSSASNAARLYTSAYVSVRQRTSAYASIRQHTPAYASIRQHTSAYGKRCAQRCSPVYPQTVHPAAVVAQSHLMLLPESAGVVRLFKNANAASVFVHLYQ